MSTIIFVRNLTLFGIHGTKAIATNTPRQFTIEAKVWLTKSVSFAAKTDNLCDTFDYEHVLSAAKEVMEGPSVNLIETLAFTIASRVRQHDKVAKIKLTLWKREFMSDVESGITIVQ